MASLILGFLFGTLLQSARLNRFDAFSSLLFAFFAFAGLLLTGKFFYAKK